MRGKIKRYVAMLLTVAMTLNSTGMVTFADSMRISTPSVAEEVVPGESTGDQEGVGDTEKGTVSGGEGDQQGSGTGTEGGSGSTGGPSDTGTAGGNGTGGTTGQTGGPSDG